jgi:hypothetical protein
VEPVALAAPADEPGDWIVEEVREADRAHAGGESASTPASVPSSACAPSIPSRPATRAGSCARASRKVSRSAAVRIRESFPAEPAANAASFAANCSARARRLVQVARGQRWSTASRITSGASDCCAEVLAERALRDDAEDLKRDVASISRGTST